MVSLWGHFVGLPVRRSVQLPWRSPRVRSCLSIQGIWIRPVRKSSLLGALLRVILKIYSNVVQSRKFLRDSISLCLHLTSRSLDFSQPDECRLDHAEQSLRLPWSNYDVTITGNSGSEAETTRVQVRVLAPGATNQLTLTATSNITGGTAPLTVSFSSEASGGISPYSYSWSFDDGQSSAVSSPVHTYSLPRFYSANVTVTDAGGRSVSQTVGITVLAQPPIQNGSLLSTYLSYGLVGSLVGLGLMVVLYLRRDAQLKHGSSGDATRATSGNP